MVKTLENIWVSLVNSVNPRAHTHSSFKKKFTHNEKKIK